jgi:muramoyltetrapeptide carboxypeptidase LdcA involved in peptidoglycan recycling
MNGHTIKKISFIAPSTCLPRRAKGALDRTIRLVKRAFGTDEAYLSPLLFSSDEQIDHITASVDVRSEHFKRVIREQDLIFSVAGGTGAEDLAPRIDRKDYAIIRGRRPVFVGFSDFTFLLNEIYFHTRVPVIYFPSLRMGKGNINKVLPLIMGGEVQDQGAAWLTPPPVRRFSGIPIGGNLSTFVNFLNRDNPPLFNWKRHILFFEDIQIDVEDLHRLLAALKRHHVFRQVRGIVIGSLHQYGRNHNYRKHQKEALDFVTAYLADVLRWRRKQGRPLPILAVSNFGHNIERNVMAVPIGGYVSISKSRKIIFRMHKPRRTPKA